MLSRTSVGLGLSALAAFTTCFTLLVAPPETRNASIALYVVFFLAFGMFAGVVAGRIHSAVSGGGAGSAGHPLTFGISGLVAAGAATGLIATLVGPLPSANPSGCDPSGFEQLNVEVRVKSFNDILKREPRREFETSSKDAALWLWTDSECWVVRATVTRNTVTGFSLTSLSPTFDPVMPIPELLGMGPNAPRLQRTSFAELPWGSLLVFGSEIDSKGNWYFGEEGYVGAGVDQNIAVLHGYAGDGFDLPSDPDPDIRAVLDSFERPCGVLPCEGRGTEINDQALFDKARATWKVSTVSILSERGRVDGVFRDLLRDPLRGEL